MKQKRSWIILVLLSVTAGAVAIQNRASQINEPLTEIPHITDTIPIVESPTLTPTYEGCAYVWAYHDAPQLTDKVNSAVSALVQNGSANASLYGEDCIYADGHSTFGAMETDFYVRLPVKDLKDTETFGNWMAQILSFITEIPREDLKGNYGFAEFQFKKSETENIIVRVPIQDYINNAKEKNGVELFQMFFKPLVTPAPT